METEKNVLSLCGAIEKNIGPMTKKNPHYYFLKEKGVSIDLTV